jgi:hypothetical protein
MQGVFTSLTLKYLQDAGHFGVANPTLQKIMCKFYKKT